jgi:hypothetical protein
MFQQTGSRRGQDCIIQGVSNHAASRSFKHRQGHPFADHRHMAAAEDRPCRRLIVPLDRLATLISVGPRPAGIPAGISHLAA